jgi:hypothetical protein
MVSKSDARTAPPGMMDPPALRTMAALVTVPGLTVLLVRTEITSGGVVSEPVPVKKQVWGGAG